MYEYGAFMEGGKIIDGDSIRLGYLDLGFNVRLYNQSVRFFGIDTPESYGTRRKDPVEYKFGMLAKQYVIDHLTESFTLKTHKDKKGKFGRILGEPIVYIPEFDREMSICKVMVLKHLAVEYHGQSKDEIKEQHLKNRETLYEQGLVLRG
jgi:endonuclease YncB( thermonuclease family)